jgi:Acyl-CoA carboxylase epsilon subunit
VSRVSGTNVVSDGNETNGQAPVSGDENAAPDTTGPREPHIHVLKGRPTDAEVAALVAVLGSAVGGGGEPPTPVFSQWGLPVDKLRYSIHSWQRMSLQQRTHMRGR